MGLNPFLPGIQVAAETDAGNRFLSAFSMCAAGRKAPSFERERQGPEKIRGGVHQIPGEIEEGKLGINPMKALKACAGKIADHAIVKWLQTLGGRHRLGQKKGGGGPHPDGCVVEAAHLAKFQGIGGA